MKIKIFDTFGNDGIFDLVRDKTTITLGITRKKKEYDLGNVIYLTLQLCFTSAEFNFTNIDFEKSFRFLTDFDETLEVSMKNDSIVAEQTDSKTLITMYCFLHLARLSSGNRKVLWKGYDENGTSVLIGQSDEIDIKSSFEEVFRHMSSESIANIDSNSQDQEGKGRYSYLQVGLKPIDPVETKDVAFWTAIRNGTEGLSFKNYSAFMDFLFCGGVNPFESEASAKDHLKKINKNKSLPFSGTDAYRAFKVASEAFVMVNIEVSGKPDEIYKDRYENYLEMVSTGVDKSTVQIIPYLAIIRRKFEDIKFQNYTFNDSLEYYLDKGSQLIDTCFGLISTKLQFPCLLELIWNYWIEESMMVQGLNAICRRFQNIKADRGIDPMANIEINPLRPLSNLLWSHIQDEQHRLTVRRRAYEYDHHYGITLQGNALKGMHMADSRSKFIEAFHTLMNLCTKFFKQRDNTTVVADGFPILNALREVHMILSEGAHNQYGDLPSTSRVEMLMQQYLLSRPELREFLPSRQMVAYPEQWMNSVSVINQLQGWTKTNVIHFRDLALNGEQILLSIRFGAWSDVTNRDQAANWAIFWRSQIQNYIHAYRTVTGVDLTREDGRIDAQQPSIHLLRRLNEQNGKTRV